TYKGCRSDNFTVKQQEAINTDPGEALTIGGVTWSKYNLANPKQASGGATFATKLPSQLSGTRAESHGKFYQWGINVAWNSTGALDGGTPSGSWNTSTNPADWSTQPCPDGYRLPTNTEFQSLIDNCTRTNGGGWSATDYYYITLTLKTDTSKKLEFPAVGYRNISDGSLVNAGMRGLYWSSVVHTSKTSNAYSLYFDSSNLFPQDDWVMRYALSVRCVKGSYTADDEVEMVDLKWKIHNLANPKQADGGATFATKLPSECSGTRAESHGKLYQWGINVAWNSTGESASGATPSGSWNNSSYPADWNTQPCPDGYRLPTNTEYQNLIDNCTVAYNGGWSSSDYGYIT
ncbi:MAG: fibrobacter succinogenes major paralogous domain-containing protein, partial [Rikenellaceae bacterium]|nr:fibrobacter succinogenes major paralogous domain-containing protein [Rikenellaceae bacterium]